MPFMDLAQNRYSERYFDSRPVEPEKLSQILEAGRIAPTGCNYQPQRIYVIRSEEAMQKAVQTRASLCGCPVVLLVCYDKETVWHNPKDRCYDSYNCGEQDASIVAASMMFEAEELGVHSLWIRGFDTAAKSKSRRRILWWKISETQCIMFYCKYYMEGSI